MYPQSRYSLGASMRSANESLPSAATAPSGFRIVMDGIVHGRGAKERVQETSQRQQPKKGGQRPVIAHHANTFTSASTSASSDPLPLAAWEERAVRLYRTVRHHRQNTATNPHSPSERHKATEKFRADDELNAGAPSTNVPFSSLLVTAFPNNFRSGSHMVQQTAQLPDPLLLRFFLHVGYPLQLPRDASTSTAASAGGTSLALLLAAATQTIRWFTRAVVVAEGSCDIPVEGSEGFELQMLPCVVQQMIGAYRMSPSAASLWLLRVFVGLLNVLHRRETERRRRAGVSVELRPLWLVSKEASRAMGRCAAAIRDALLQLHDASLQLAGQRTPQEASASDKEDVEERRTCSAPSLWVAPGTSVDQTEWGVVHYHFLRHTTGQLLRGCDVEINDSEVIVAVDAAEANPHHPLAPRVSSSPVVLDGLMRCLFTTRSRFNGRRGNDGAKAATPAPHPVQLGWAEYAASLLRDSGGFLPRRHRYTGQLSVVLSLD